MTRMNNLQVNVIHVTSTSCRLGHSLPKAAILRTLGFLVLGCLKGPYTIMSNLCIDNFMVYKVPIAVPPLSPSLPGNHCSALWLRIWSLGQATLSPFSSQSFEPPSPLVDPWYTN